MSFLFDFHVYFLLLFCVFFIHIYKYHFSSNTKTIYLKFIFKKIFLTFVFAYCTDTYTCSNISATSEYS